MDNAEGFEGDFNASIKDIKQKVDAANACLIPEKSSEIYRNNFINYLITGGRKKSVNGVNKNLILLPFLTEHAS